MKLRVICSTLVILAFVAYIPALQAGFFCWDDDKVALAQTIRSLNLSAVIHAFSSFHVGLYHPLTTISFMLDYRVGNGAAFPFHMTNLLLNTANTLLLFFFLFRMTGDMRIAFFTAILFAVHPAHVESVAWITSRKDLLYTFFFLLSALFYNEYSSNRNKILNYSFALVFALFALLSKIQAVALPFIFLLIDYYRGNRFRVRMIVDKIPFLLFSLFFGILNILAQKDYGYASYGYHFSIAEKTVLFPYSISLYFLKTIFPWPLSVFYPYPIRPREEFPLFSMVIPIVFIIIIISLFYFYKRGRKPLIFGLLWFLLNIVSVAVISFNRDAVIADRYSYLASAGILFGAACLISDLVDKFPGSRRMIIGLFIMVAAILSTQTFLRTALWKDPESLFRQALSHYPNSEIILNTLASREIDSGKYREAILHLDRAIDKFPEYTDAYFNRGLAFGKSGQPEASIRDLSAAIKLNPAYFEAYFARGNSYMKTNNLQAAYDDFTAVIRLNKDHFGAFQNRAIVRGNLEDYAGAIEDLNAAIALDPEFAASYYLKGIALFNTGENGCAYLYKAFDMGYTDAARAIDYYCK